MSIKKLYNPEIFQGSILKNNYFEGWFFKMVTADSKDIIAIIVGIATGKTLDTSHSFIQINYKGKSEFFPFDISSFSYGEDEFWVKINENFFSSTMIKLDLDSESISIKGTLSFDNIIPYPKTLLNPGIMGCFSYLRFMECYHGLVNMQHTIKGQLTINSTPVDFNLGNGYIEKDWGTSFPKRYLWLQCGNFLNSNASIVVAIADIPFIGMEFQGILVFLYEDGKYHNISTYNGAKVTNLNVTENTLTLSIKNFSYIINIKAALSDDGGTLKAPVKGNMNREIKETLMSSINISIRKKGKTIFENQSDSASIEVCGY